MIELRDYQKPFYKNILSKVGGESVSKVCAFLPTGGGKSVVIGKLANSGLPGRTLILTHRIEIFKQNAGWLKEAAWLSSNENTLKYNSRIIIAMVQTLDARIKNYGIDYIGQIDNIILDEVHIQIFGKVFSKYNYKNLIGFTGSLSIYGKKLEWEVEGETYVEDFTLSHIFDDLVVGPDTHELIEIGRLVPEHTIALKLPDFDKLKESSSNPDGYTSKSMNEVYYNTVSFDKLMEGYNKFCIGKKTMIFNANNRINKFVYDNMKKAGVNCMMFDTSKHREINPNTGKKYKREEVVEWFRNQRDAVLINTNVFTTGFDVDDVECIIVNRATKSLSLWIQIVGRGARVTNKILKPKFTVLDLGQNVYEHGLWSAPRNWEEIFKGPGPRLKQNLDYLQIWECDSCGYYNPKGTIICEDCGFEKITKISEKEKKLKEGEFEEVNTSPIPTANKIIEYCIRNNLKVSDAFKIMYNSIVDLFDKHNVTKEFYLKRKKEFKNRVREIYRPIYFAIISESNGLEGNKKRKFNTVYDRLIKEIERRRGYE